MFRNQRIVRVHCWGSSHSSEVVTVHLWWFKRKKKAISNVQALNLVKNKNVRIDLWIPHTSYSVSSCRWWFRREKIEEIDRLSMINKCYVPHWWTNALNPMYNVSVQHIARVLWKQFNQFSFTTASLISYHQQTKKKKLEQIEMVIEYIQMFRKSIQNLFSRISPIHSMNRNRIKWIDNYDLVTYNCCIGNSDFVSLNVSSSSFNHMHTNRTSEFSDQKRKKIFSKTK